MVRNKIKFSSVGIYYSLTGDRVEQIALQINEILKNSGVEVLFTKTNKKKSSTKNTYTDHYFAKNSEFIISIGGDGTLLSCARKFGYLGIPILGINLGTLGFLTDVQPEEITSTLIKILEGKYIKDRRFFLEAKVNNSEKSFIALNEAVIHSGSVAKLIEYTVFIDEAFVYKQKADGIIISTPTGSTAYSLSGNGPIIHPSLGSISLLPMFPHSLSSSPLVVGAESEIKIKLTENSSSAQISFDSHNFVNLKGKNEIHIGKSQSVLELIHPLDHDFYDGCRSKLGWSTSISKS